MQWKHAILVLLSTDGEACIDHPLNLLLVYSFFMEEVIQYPAEREVSLGSSWEKG
jgi:hypothetical protein